MPLQSHLLADGVPSAFPIAGGLLNMAAVKEAVRLLRFGEFICNNGALPDDIWYQVLEDLDVGTLAQLRRTCKSLRRLVSKTLYVRLRKMLLPYAGTDDRVDQLIALMEVTFSLVGGGEAVQFARAIASLTRNIDFFTPFGSAQRFIDLFVSWGGEIRDAEAGCPVYHNLETRVDTARVTCIALNGREVHIIESRTPTAMYAVLDGWTTVQTTVVTSKFVVVGHPHMTLDGMGLYTSVTRHIHRNVSNATIRKYERRGFQHFDAAIYGDFGTKCMSTWWSIDKTDRVCMLPLDYGFVGPPREFGDNLRWRVDCQCRIVGCPHHRDDDSQSVTELQWLRNLRG